jgi:hypothetical protein
MAHVHGAPPEKSRNVRNSASQTPLNQRTSPADISAEKLHREPLLFKNQLLIASVAFSVMIPEDHVSTVSRGMLAEPRATVR